jgi:hypothetical protein
VAEGARRGAEDVNRQAWLPNARSLASAMASSSVSAWSMVSTGPNTSVRGEGAVRGSTSATTVGCRK